MKSHKIDCRIDDKTNAWLLRRAKLQGISKSDLARYLFAQAMRADAKSASAKVRP